MNIFLTILTLYILVLAPACNILLYRQDSIRYVEEFKSSAGLFIFFAVFLLPWFYVYYSVVSIYSHLSKLVRRHRNKF